MRQKPVVRRRRADEDLENANSFYLSEAGAEIAATFVDRFVGAVKQISRHPALGSPRYGHEVSVPDLRHWPIKRFPHVIYYLEKDKHMELVRILPTSMDIPSRLGDVD